MLVKRVSATGGNDLRTTYRPCSLDEFVGSKVVKNVLKNQIEREELAHTLLISGPSGCGKTTLARIIALTLNCEDESHRPCLKCSSCEAIQGQYSIDYQEINVGSNSGKADVDDIVSELSSSAFSSANKIIVFDECHKLTPAARDLLLKKMEDTYDHAYLIFCTNQPEKLMDTKKGEDPFLDRCTHIKLKQLSYEEIYGLLENVCQFEGVPYTKDILGYIVDISKGVPRKALKSLDAVIAEGSWDLQVAKELLEGIVLDEETPEVIELSKAVMATNKKLAFSTYAQLVKKFETETIRVAVAGWLVYQLKTTNDKIKLTRLTHILDFFTVPIYQTGKPAEHIFYNYIAKAILELTV